MRGDRSKTRSLVVFVPALALAIAVSSADAAALPSAGPRLLTNRAAYVGGDAVKFSGYGFLPYESVGLAVESAGKTVGAPWTVFADAEGRVEADWRLDEAAGPGADFTVRAVGGSSRAAVDAAFHRIAVLERTARDGDRENVALELEPGDDPWFVAADDEVDIRPF